MNTIAFKETFNTVMMAMIEGLTFVISVRFLRWSIGLICAFVGNHKMKKAGKFDLVCIWRTPYG